MWVRVCLCVWDKIVCVCVRGCVCACVWVRASVKEKMRVCVCTWVGVFVDVSLVPLCFEANVKCV